ncbi:MAG: hypothetical protein QW156_04725 [Candidatus Aenigmatarchaeota archaeon]
MRVKSIARRFCTECAEERKKKYAKLYREQFKSLHWKKAEKDDL